jgi:hypothetical protein
MEFPQCTKEQNDIKITIIDKDAKNQRSQVILDNPKRIKLKIIQIEDCVIPKGTKGGRCDTLVVVPDGHLIFIELKGKDVEKAIQQLIDSMDYLKQKCSNVSNSKISCIIACTRVPTGTDVQNYKVKFKNKYKATLLIKTGQCTYKI